MGLQKARTPVKQATWQKQKKKRKLWEKIHISSKDNFDKASYIHYNLKSDY